MILNYYTEENFSAGDSKQNPLYLIWTLGVMKNARRDLLVGSFCLQKGSGKDRGSLLPRLQPESMWCLY